MSGVVIVFRCSECEEDFDSFDVALDHAKWCNASMED